jgi:RimJ/RimL family protein N-acetyltransferase
LKVSTSPDFLQSVIDARWEWVAQDGEPRVPLAEAFGRIVALENEHGGFLFFPKGYGIWEVHTLFLHGGHALRSAREAARHMFARPDCTAITTQVPADNTPADKLTRAMGFEHIGTEPKAFVRKGIRHDVHHYALTREGWQATEGQ